MNRVGLSFTTPCCGWLVHAFACLACSCKPEQHERSQPATVNHMRQANKGVIRRSVTYLVPLIDKWRQPRVRQMIELFGAVFLALKTFLSMASRIVAPSVIAAYAAHLPSPTAFAAHSSRASSL